MTTTTRVSLVATFIIRASVVAACVLVSSEAFAQVTCIAATTSMVKGKLVTKLSKKNRPTKCLSGEVLAESGATGATGPAGADGQMRVYGDGSAGALVVSTDGGLFDNYAADGNLQFSSLTVQSGKTLGVTGGTIIRVSGDVTINGFLNVLLQGWSGKLVASTSTFSTSQAPVYQQPSQGIASTIPGIGQIGTSSADRLGGRAGLRRTFPESFQVLSDLLLLGGGGGAPGHIDELAGVGGGSVMIVAGGTVTVASGGGIDADAFINEANNGAGGAGGGVVVIAAKTAITQAGTIWARGSSGNRAGVQAGSGGGGGGGLIILASPTITVTGANLVTGGDGGVSVGAGTITQSPRIGGGGGGASAGFAGAGGTASSDGSCSGGGDGGDGKVYQLNVDPTAML